MIPSPDDAARRLALAIVHSANGAEGRHGCPDCRRVVPLIVKALDSARQQGIAEGEKAAGEEVLAYHRAAVEEYERALAAEARERSALSQRDQEWWDALAGVPGVGPEPEDVKRWVMQERELVVAEARREALEEAAKLAELPCGHYQVGRAELPFWSGDKIAAAIRALAAEPPQEKG